MDGHMKIWQVSKVEPDNLETTLNQDQSQGWTLYQMFQKPGQWEGDVVYLLIWSKE